MAASTSFFDLLLQTGGSRRHAGQAINLDTAAPSSAAESGASDSTATSPRSFEGRTFGGAPFEATTPKGGATNDLGSAPFSTATASIHRFVTHAAPAVAPSSDAAPLSDAGPLSGEVATGLLTTVDPLSLAATDFNTTDNPGTTCHCRICQEGLLPSNQSGPLEGQTITSKAGTTATGTVTGGSASALGSSVDLGRTFFLHSNPTATKTIYLDFNGHTTTGTAWNTKAQPTINTSAFDFDGNVNVFSNTELERIQFIWQRVAEDFAPFGINVTTQDLGADALTNTGSRDNQWGVRAAIGGSFSDWYGSSAGGVAYVNSFGNAAFGPAFVFSKSLGGGNEKYTAEAISHEVGHSLGLMHDGTSSASYFQGQGTGATGWASIMGSGYYKNVTQWSQGEYNGANNKQDDLAIISGSSNGAGYRADDFGNSAATAKVLRGTSLNQFGIIETRSDSDWFRFATGTGNISLSINNACQAWISNGFGSYSNSLLAGRSPNLDIAATLYGADGTLIASSNPLDKLTASFNLNLDAGTYFLKVEGVGFGNPLSNGYSDYGSLGQYLLTGSLVATSNSSAVSELPPNQVMGDANASTLDATNAKDILTGGAGADTFSFASLSTSNLANYDRITDFAIGTDKLDSITAVSAKNINKLGAVSTLDLTGISALLTATSFAANRAATFSFADTDGPRTFLALNDATAGFSATNDAIVEITGFSGSLANLAVI